MRLRLLIFQMLICASISPGFSQSLSAEDWKEDVDALADFINVHHVNPFWLQSEKAFKKLVQKVRDQISQPDLSNEARYIELMKLIASTRDGHSYLNNRYALFGYLPYSCVWVGEELLISRAIKPYQRAVGCTILEIDGIPLAKVRQLIQPIISTSNESGFRRFSPRYLHLAGLLYGLGITAHPEKATFTLKNTRGEIFDLEMEVLSEADEQRATFVKLNDTYSQEPLYRQNQNRNYSFTYLESEKLLYVNYRRCVSMKEESIWTFAQRLFAFADSQKIDKFVLDIRDNGGGGNHVNLPFIQGIRSRPALNQPGKLFVITGRRTFSAAVQCAIHMESKTHALIVGEPAGDYPVHPGDNETFTLPHSGLKVSLSQLFHESSFYEDKRPELVPDIPVQFSLEDFLEGKDPVLEAILSYKHTTRPTSVPNAHNYVRSYRFSPDRMLRIIEDGGGLRMEISKSVYSPLFPTGKNRFNTNIKGLSLEIPRKGICTIIYPDGHQRQLEQIDDSLMAPIELIYAGEFELAAQRYQEIKTRYPDLVGLLDHSLAAEAMIVFNEVLAKEGRKQASEKARALLRIAIKLNPRGTFAKESLQYY